MNNVERRLRDQRTLEAMRNNYMGFQGKLAAIARVLGDPIQHHESELYDVMMYDGTPESWEDTFNEFLPTAEWGTRVVSLGHNFDGLSRGYHLEIHLWRPDNRIIVNYKGYTVYTEMNGRLEGYAPFPEWESLIDILYKQAQNRAKDKGISLKEDQEVQQVVEKESFLKKLRMRWGI